MLVRKHGVRKLILILPLFLLLSGQVQAQHSPGLDATDSIIIPGPNPFSLDAESAVYCIDLLKKISLMEVKDENDKSKIVKVQTVWSYFLEFEESFPEGHRRRYDIIVNGFPLDWDNSFIEVGGEMINLRLLFLYRNQHPPKGLDYYNNP